MRGIPQGPDDPLLGVDAGHPGEVRISSDTMIAISHLYETSPSIRACRAILFGQMLGSGVVVKRGGNNVKLTDAFARYLEERWIPFARDVIDNFLKFGFSVVSIENDAPPPFAGLREQRKRQRAGEPPPVRDSAAARKQSVAYPQSAAAIVAKGVRNIAMDARDNTTNMVPLVPDPTVYMLSFIRRDDSNYKREYRVYSTSSRNVRCELAGLVVAVLDPARVCVHRCSAKTLQPRSSSARSPTRLATCGRRLRRSSSRRASSRRSRSWRCRPRSSARASCS